MSTQTFQLSAALTFLSRIWVREIDLATLESLNEPAMLAAFTELGASIPNKIDEETVEELAVDYCQLLIGPKNHIPPVQSIWSQQRFQGNAAASMIRYFELLPDYNPPIGSPDGVAANNGMLDHFGVQIDFLGSLLISDQVEDVTNQLVQQFFSDHIKWSLPVIRKIQNQAGTDFYHGMAKNTLEMLNTFEEKS
jgi:TorA maturation chaperone TorD